MHPTLLAILVTGGALLGVGGAVIAGSAWLTRFEARGAGLRRVARGLRAWLFLGPALALLVVYLGYPVVETLRLSMTVRLDTGGVRWVGGDTYLLMVRDPKFSEALCNTALWLALVPAVSTALGVLIAWATERLAWRALARAVIFMPMAISFVAASVIFKLIYDLRPLGQPQIGLLNALALSLGADAPQAWLTLPGWNTVCLMVVMIWVQTGFAMVILAAALARVPPATLEAARLDGASHWQVLWYIQLPQIRPAVLVVWSTLVIVVLKLFDIVYALTNGQWGTQVLANYMFGQVFQAQDWGRGSAAAAVILVLVLPVVIWNLRAARRDGDAA